MQPKRKYCIPKITAFVIIFFIFVINYSPNETRPTTIKSFSQSKAQLSITSSTSSRDTINWGSCGLFLYGTYGYFARDAIRPHFVNATTLILPFPFPYVQYYKPTLEMIVGNISNYQIIVFMFDIPTTAWTLKVDQIVTVIHEDKLAQFYKWKESEPSLATIKAMSINPRLVNDLQYKLSHDFPSLSNNSYWEGAKSELILSIAADYCTFISSVGLFNPLRAKNRELPQKLVKELTSYEKYLRNIKLMTPHVMIDDCLIQCFLKGMYATWASSSKETDKFCRNIRSYQTPRRTAGETMYDECALIGGDEYALSLNPQWGTIIDNSDFVLRFNFHYPKSRGHGNKTTHVIGDAAFVRGMMKDSYPKCKWPVGTKLWNFWGDTTIERNNCYIVEQNYKKNYNIPSTRFYTRASRSGADAFAGLISSPWCDSIKVFGYSSHLGNVGSPNYCLLESKQDNICPMYYGDLFLLYGFVECASDFVEFYFANPTDRFEWSCYGNCIHNSIGFLPKT